MKVIIFGAGPCGLTAAWELAKNGIAPTVIEKENTVGGLCKTYRRNGFQFDLGGHRFISKDNELIRDIQLLMGDELLTRNRKSVIRFHDREYDYPINFLNVIKESTPWMTLKFALGYLASSTGLVKSKAPAKSFERWVDIRFGKPLNDYFFSPYTEKLWGIPASQLSDEWAPQRISLLNAGNALLKALGLSKSSPRTYAVKYLYPKKGIGSIFETMAEDIERMGGKIITGVKPLMIEKNENRASKVFIGKENKMSGYLEADHYLSTIPLDDLTKLLGEDTFFPLPSRSLRFLNIELNRENLSPNTWIYVPESNLMMTRIQEPKQRSPWSAPKGKTSVMLEIPCTKGDNVWSMEDEKLLHMALKDLKTLGFDLAGDVKGYFSTWAEKAYPRYDIDKLHKIEKMRETVKKFENLTSLGRQGLFRYIFMDTAMLMGRQWARKILKNKNIEEQIDEFDSQSTLLETESLVV